MKQFVWRLIEFAQLCPSGTKLFRGANLKYSTQYKTKEAKKQQILYNGSNSTFTSVGVQVWIAPSMPQTAIAKETTQHW